MAKLFQLFGEIFIDNDEANKSIDKTTEKAEGAGSKIGSAFKSIAKGAAAVGTAVGTAAVAIGTKAVSSATDAEQAMRSFAAGTNISSNEIEKYNEVLKGVYSNNYGEGYEDIAENMKLAYQQLGELDPPDLQKVVENGYLLQDTFDMDFSESIRGVSAMMKQFGIDADTAYNLIAQGAKNGLNQNGDLADQLAEYSVYYSSLGFTAEETMNIIANGAKDGTFQIDYLNDAIKEFGIRAKDNSDTTKKAFAALGLDAQQLTSDFAEGGEKSKNAFLLVKDALASVEDNVKRNELGVALFGTKWEDLGESAIMALSATNGEISATTDSLSEMADTKYGDLGSMITGLGRTVETHLIPIGQKIIPFFKNLIEKSLPKLTMILERINPIVVRVFDNLLPPLFSLTETLLPIAIELIIVLLPLIENITTTVLPIIISLLEMLSPFLLQIANSILPLILNLISALLPILEVLLPLLQPLLDITVAIIAPLVELLNLILIPIINVVTKIIEFILPVLHSGLSLLAEMLSTKFKIAFEAVGNIFTNIKNIFQNIIDFVKNVFTGNWKGAWQNVVDIFKNIWKSMENIVKTPINFIITAINTMINGINKLSFEVPDWVPGIGGETFGFDIPNVPKLRRGLEYVPHDDYPALLHKGEQVLTASERKERIQEQKEKQKEPKNEPSIVVKVDVHIERFENNSPSDIEDLAEELMYIIEEKIRGKKKVFE